MPGDYRDRTLCSTLCVHHAHSQSAACFATVGQYLAKIEPVVALATLLGHYSFAPAPRMGNAQDITDKMIIRFTVRTHKPSLAAAKFADRVSVR
jgi:hypothetical protein